MAVSVHKAALAFAAAFAGLSGVADAAEDARAYLAVSADNDSPSWEDRDYSSGLSVTYGRRLSETRWLNFELAHALYTPTNIERTTQDPADRPYAGLAYASAGVSAQSDNATSYLGATLGVLGPSARGEDVQRFIHRATGFVAPQGWAQQLPDKLIANIRYARSQRLATFSNADISALVSLDAGTLETGARVGLGVRAGGSLPRGDSTARYTLRAPNPIAGPGAEATFVFGGVAARYTAYDARFDGAAGIGSFVRPEKAGWEAWGGVNTHLIGTTIQLTYSVRSNDFKRSDKTVSSVAAATLSWAWR